LRYNVNGIELDSPTFLKLRKEIAMRKVTLQSEAGGGDDYYIGRFLDRHKTQHWIVVREAPVRRLKSDGTLAPPQTEARFYEVVRNDEVIRTIKEKVYSEIA